MELKTDDERIARLPWMAARAFELMSRCPAVNAHHFLELLALQAGQKRVVRLALNSEDWLALQAFCEDAGLLAGHSRRKQAPVEEQAHGDVFTMSVDWDDPSGRYIVALISTEAEALGEAVRLEDRPSSADEFGRCYGYPCCCVEAYPEIQRAGDWIAAYLRRSPLSGPGYALGNRLAEVFDGSTLLPEYYPCSTQCAATRELAQTYLSLATRAGLPRLGSVLASLAAPILVWGGDLYQLAGARREGRRLTYDAERALPAPFNRPGRDAAFWRGNGVEAEGGTLRLLEDGVVLAAAEMSLCNNRLLLFE